MVSGEVMAERVPEGREAEAQEDKESRATASRHPITTHSLVRRLMKFSAFNPMHLEQRLLPLIEKWPKCTTQTKLQELAELRMKEINGAYAELSRK